MADALALGGDEGRISLLREGANNSIRRFPNETTQQFENCIHLWRPTW